MPRSRPLRICHILTRLSVRGVPRHVLDLVSSLDPTRFEVEVYTGYSEEGEGDLWDEARGRGVKVKRIPDLRRSVNPIKDLKAFMSILNNLREDPFDIVHTDISKSGVLGRWAARLAGIPITIHTYHGIPNEWRGNCINASIFRLIETMTAKYTSSLISVSNYVQNQIQEIVGSKDDRWRVIYNGIDIDHFNRKTTHKIGSKPQLLVVGSLTPEKGIDLLIEAMPLVCAECPEMRLVVIGNGPQREHIQRRISELCLDEVVQFEGIVSDLRPWFYDSKILVVPSRNEGLGLVAIEAMAAGLPVVAHSVGGLVEVIENGRTGILCEPSNKISLANAIIRVIKDQVMSLKMGGNAIERAYECFAIDQMVKQVQQLYEHLAHNLE